ncbi:hypothetical protein HDU76_010769, partial [Blyttiomyces sp. JEL0837]
WYENNEEFMCKMTNCTQSIINDKYNWYCGSLTCTCVPNSAFCGGPGKVVDLSGPISQANGDFSFGCDGNTSNCNAQFSFLNDLFPTGLELPTCNFGECAFPTDNPELKKVTIRNDLTMGEKVGVGLLAGLAFLGVSGLVWSAIMQYRAKRTPAPPPRKGATITFNHISYLVKGKSILVDITGTAPSGQIMAIMGPSGAGKSSLLDIMHGKSKSGIVKGTVMVDGHLLPASILRSLIGYVDQEDLLMPALTVRETLMFSAMLRLPESVSIAEKKKRVEEVLSTLGLMHCAETRIGGFGKRGISGGEKRRVSIGVELVTSPSVLLLDEPTSGLDSFNALSVVRTLADLAHKHGKTIIFTIHQPRSDVYTLFDNVLVLAGGATLYCGPGSGASAHVRNMGSPCPDGYNM